jgi:hypothetical protein
VNPTSVDPTGSAAFAFVKGRSVMSGAVEDACLWSIAVACTAPKMNVRYSKPGLQATLTICRVTFWPG